MTPPPPLLAARLWSLRGSLERTWYDMASPSRDHVTKVVARMVQNTASTMATLHVTYSALESVGRPAAALGAGSCRVAAAK